MPDIGNIGSSYAASIAPGARIPADLAARRAVETTSSPARAEGDRVEVSEAAKWLEEMNRLPAIRENKVAAAKAAIANGSLDSDAKLAIAIERMIDDVV